MSHKEARNTESRNLMDLLPGDGDGFGAHIGTIQPLADFILNRYVERYDLVNQKAALPDGDRPMVYLTAHGPLTAPTPSLAILTRLYIENGLGDRAVNFFPHPSLLRIPGAKKLFAKLGIATRAYDVDVLVDLLKSGRIQMTGTALEGIYCNLSWKEYVGPFESGGMIVAAIRSGATICLMANLGGEAWNKRLNLPFGLTVPLTKGLRGVNLPLPPIRKFKHYQLIFKRYRPALTEKQLAKMSRREAHLAVSVEMAKIRKELILLVDELKSRREKTTANG